MPSFTAEVPAWEFAVVLDSHVQDLTDDLLKTTVLLDGASVPQSPSAWEGALVTLAMFPILVFMYGRLAKTEERDMLAQFGDEYLRYMAAVPGFFPKLGFAGKEPGAMRRP